MSGPSIPERRSSKRAAPPSGLEEERNNLNEDIKVARKKLKPRGSYDEGYWRQRTEISQKLQTYAQIQKKISLRDFEAATGEGECEWLITPAAKHLVERLKGAELDEKLYQKQADQLKPEPNNEGKGIRRGFLKLFTTSKSFGLGIGLMGAGPRDSSIQSNFRSELIKISNAEHPQRGKTYLWCPVIGEFLDESAITAAHIFAHFHGQEIMDAIFGAMDPPELFSPRNGILMSKQAEKHFDKGHIVIVPTLSSNSSASDVNSWQHQHPERYEIRVLDRDGQGMENFISVSSELKWSDLDGRELQFRSDHRPRARYLYFHYCASVLRLSWRTPEIKTDGTAVTKELKKRFWGTPGRYMRRNMLLAFVEELGHEYESLLEGAMDDSGQNEEPEAIALAAANLQVTVSGADEEERGEDEESDSDSETDEEDEEDEDFPY